MTRPDVSLPTVAFADGGRVPALGLGTWRMGERGAALAAEEASLRHALERGVRLFDTAEMYGDGGAESVLGAALGAAMRARDVARESLFIVSKVLPQNADAAGVVAACDASRRRLGLDVIDLYLLHWRGGVPLAQTLAGFERLLARGHVRRVGVSNFDVDDLDEWTALTGGTRCDANQVWYSLGERGPEHALIPWQRQHGVPLMAYCPLDQGTLARHAALRAVGERHGAAAATVALAWLLGQPGVIVIPKAVQPQHLDDVLAAPRLRLDDDDHAALARAFPAPTRRRPLAMR